jgi:hypothetical protein
MSNEMEKLFDQVAHDLGWHDHNMSRDRPYSGQPHTDTGIRGATEIRGITFRDLRDCYIRAVLLSTGGRFYETDDPKLKARMAALYKEADKGEAAALCENDVYGFSTDQLDPIAICQNLCCEVEKIMGIFPNVPGLSFTTDLEPAK